MLRQSLTLAIVFTDISGSTSLYESLGDDNAHKLVNSCITAVSKVVSDYHGTVIKTIGDGVMSTFADAGMAVNASISMQKALDSLHLSIPDKNVVLNMRIGLHWGPVIKQNYDVFGDAVNVAARMVALAKPRQILTTEQTIDSLPTGFDVNLKRADRTTIKGKGGEFSLYEIVWEEQDQTIMLSNDPTIPVISTRLHLSMGEKELFIDINKPAAVLGRQAYNDIVVSEVTASRMHARIEYRHGKFILIDKSTNGSYVSMEGKKSVFVHNDEIVLGSRGYISLGCEVNGESPQAIHFAYEYKDKGLKP